LRINSVPYPFQNPLGRRRKDSALSEGSVRIPDLETE
jgi:hypothetical protein